MKLPRDLSGGELISALARFGYVVTRQRGSHIRLTTVQNGEHSVTVPAHDPIKLGTLSAILNDIAEHLDMTKVELADALFGG
jgi:predicted RNA binding protein YcfA (HicA-like mRNA interferase family)